MQKPKLLTEIKLSETRLTHSQSEKVISSLFNIYSIKAYRYTATVNDTNYSYWVYTNQKVNKPKLEAIKHFIEGIKYAM